MGILLTFTFIFILSLVTVTSEVPTTVSGYRGGSVNIRCNYTAGYEENKKYLCRGKCSTWSRKDIPVESGSDPEDKRFSLYDNTTASVFIITLTDLRAEDEGTYWCGVQHTFFDDYIEILLLVTTDYPVRSTIPPSTTVHTLTEENKTEDLPIQGVALYSLIGAGLTLVAAAMIAVIYCKIKCKGPKPSTQTLIEPNGDHHNNCNPKSDSVYESIKDMTNASPAVFPTQYPQSNQSGSSYQSSNSTTCQIYTICQTLNPLQNQPHSIYETMNPQGNQSKSMCQIMKSETNQLDSVDQAMTHKTHQSDPVYETMRFKTKSLH